MADGKTTVLVTFLGGAYSNVEQTDGNPYERLTYVLDGEASEQLWCGAALTDLLKPSRVIVIGTRSSFWGHALDSAFLQLVMNPSKPVAGLSQAQQRWRHTPEDERTAELLQLALGGDNSPLRGVLIEHQGFRKDEQVQFLTALRCQLQASGADALYFDVTHGYRHFPMLAMLAAQFLQMSLKTIGSIGYYYGAAAQGNEGEAQIIRLEGLTALGDWVDAVKYYDKTGDYSAIAGQMISSSGDDGIRPELAELSASLTSAALYERANLYVQAAEKVQKARDQLQSLENDGSPVSLLKTELLSRMAWSQGTTDAAALYKTQRAIAMEHLKRRDLARGVLAAVEAFVTGLCHNDGVSDFTQHRSRETSKRKHENVNQTGPFTEINQLRNIIAHIAHGEPGKTIEKFLEANTDASAIVDLFIEKIKALLPEDPP